MKCVCPMGGDRTCPDDCPLAVWAGLSAADRKAQRKSVAERLYRQGFTMEQIATQLGVGYTTVNRDLGNLSHSDKLKSDKTATNPKGAGRPKGSGNGRQRRHRESASHETLEQALAGSALGDGTKRKARRAGRPSKNTASKKDAAASLFLDRGLTRDQVKVETGLGEHEIQLAVERERGRREAVPNIDPNSLSMSVQEKLQAAIRQEKRRLDVQFEQRVLDEIRKRVEETVLPSYNRTHKEYLEVIKARRGIMNRANYMKILSCLHPDSRQSVSDRKLHDAFHLFTQLERRLLDESEAPTETGRLPRTYEEMAEARRRTTEARRARRGQHNGVAYR